MSFLLNYLIALVVFLIIDLVWLLLIARRLYKAKLGHLMAEKANWLAAVVFYLIFIAAIVFFVVEPALAADSLPYALGVGAFFGLVAYATYDLTNLATLKAWPISITIIDLVWGTFLSSATAALTMLISRRLG